MVDRFDWYCVSYDKSADTAYLSNGEPICPTDSILDENFILVRFLDDKVQSLTITGFLDRINDGTWDNNHILRYNFPIELLQFLPPYKL